MMNEWKPQFLNALPKWSLYLLQGSCNGKHTWVNNAQYFKTRYLLIKLDNYLHTQADYIEYSLWTVRYYLDHNFKETRYDIFRPPDCSKFPIDAGLYLGGHLHCQYFDINEVKHSEQCGLWIELFIKPLYKILTIINDDLDIEIIKS
jgi:hypothetical protein